MDMELTCSIQDCKIKGRRQEQGLKKPGTDRMVKGDPGSAHDSLITAKDWVQKPVKH